MIHLFNTTENKTLDLNETKPETHTQNLENRAICCRQCLNEVTYENFYFEKNDSHIHSFSNPYGYIFTIRCFSNAPGSITTGPFSNEFSWFKNHSWKITLCGKCMTHLGWMFQSKDSTFFGLITEKII